MNDFRKLLNVTLKESSIEVEGVTYHLRELDAPTYVRVQNQFLPVDGVELTDEQAGGLYCVLISESVIDAEGNRPLANAEGLAAIRKQPWRIVQPLGVECARLNGMLGTKKKS